MDKFHVYDILGKGKHSKVYKARKKKTILYYAIKSVDISQKDRVLQEIETMHALQHSHVLRYHQCYETRNHLWLVLEYCVGGDLKALLEKDRQLQEDAIRAFARGLVASLQYCHSQAVIYGDLKPSNLLLDENGEIKLGGFGLSKRLADIEAAADKPTRVAPMAARSGTPAYMAPELFRSGSVHSSCSDLWALGCILYECRAGRPPFTGNLLQPLINDIETTDPPNLNATPEFCDLVGRLLDKNPATRLTWQQLGAHSFWKKPIMLLPLPEERALANFISSNGLKPADSQAPREACAEAGAMAMRVSRAVRSNLQANAGGATEYTGATPGEGTEDVELHTPDAEVDFDERASDAGNSEAGDESGRGASNVMDDSAREGATAGSEQAGHAAVISGLARVSMTTSPAAAAAAQRQAQQRQRNLAQQTPQQQESLRGAINISTPPNAAPHSPSTSPVAWGGAAATHHQARAPDAGNVAALIWHASDNSVSGMAGNSRIEKLPHPKFDVAMLSPVVVWSAAQLASAPEPEKEEFLLRIYQALGSSAALRNKMNVLAYMEAQLCCHTQSANALINSEISGLLVRMLRGATASGKGSREKDGLRARLAGVLALLLRHAVYISPALAQTGILDVLTVVASDKSERVQRRAVAALGELLFYISDKDPSAGRLCVDGWVVQPATVNLMSRLLQPGTQEVVQHYVAHTIDNIVLQGGPWAVRFTDDSLASNLVTLWNTANQPALRSTAASALSRVVRHAPAQLSMLITKFGTRILVAGLSDPAEKIQTACANMLAFALASHQLGAITRATLQGGAVQDYGALQGALNLMQAEETPLLKAKGCLLVALLIRNDSCTLATACLLGLPTVADELSQKVEQWQFAHQTYVAAALNALRGEIASTTPHVVDQLATMVSPGTSATVVRRLRTSAWDVGGTAFNFSKVVLPLMHSHALHPAVASSGLVQVLARVLIATAASIDDLSVEIKTEVLQVIEAMYVTGGSATAAAQGPALALHLAPALAQVAVGTATVDTRFQALKLLLDLLLLLKTVQPARESSNGVRGLTEEVEAAVTKRLLPRAPALLTDEAPLPLYTIKLLAELLQARSGWALTVARAGLVPTVVKFLDLDDHNNNIHNLRVARYLILGGALPSHKLKQLGAAHQVGKIVAYTHAKMVSPFLEPVLELSATLLSYYTSPEGATEVCEAMMPNLLIFVELVGSPDVGAAVLAAQCALAVSKLAPADAGATLFSRDGASVVDVAMASSPTGQGGDPARQHLMLALLATANVATASITAEPGAVRQLRAAVAKLPIGGSEMEAVVKSTARMLSSLQ